MPTPPPAATDRLPAPAGPRLEGAIESRDGLELHRGYFDSPVDQRKLYYIRWTSPAAEASALPSVLLMHGYGEHAERYHELAQALAAAGYPVCAIDARGHGHSDGRRGHVNRYTDYTRDLLALLSRVEAHYPARKRVLFGHSNGGLIAIQTALQVQTRFAALILSSPLLGMRLVVPAWKAFLGRVMSRIIPALSLPSDIPPSDVTRDPEIAQRYATDPLVNKNATARYFTEMQAAIAHSFAHASQLTLPILIMQGGDDRVASAPDTRRFSTLVGSHDKTYNEYPNMFHEIFNDPERADLRADLLSWLNQRFA
jgi:alpha-beta hydrolase superfamily lysophospholipase